MKITIEIPEGNVDRLVSAYEGNDRELTEYLLPPRALPARRLHQDAVSADLAQAGNPIRVIENTCCCFHLVARRLQQRHNGRSTLEIEDEYDVQDLLHALLSLEFGDIRPEEWTPSYAGAASRTDFLIKQEHIVLEVKKARKGLDAQRLGEQLIVDIGRYKSHPDCQTLVCFVYDAEGRIANPWGIENDLNGQHDGLEVKVIIAPKGF